VTNSTTLAGCGSFPTLDKHSLNLSSGKLVSDTRAVTPNCSGNRTASQTLSYEIHIPIYPTSRNLSVLVNWTVIANASALLNRGTCSFYSVAPNRECLQLAAAQLVILPWIYDFKQSRPYYSKANWVGGPIFQLKYPCLPSHGCTSPGHGGAASVHIDQNALVSVNATGLNVSHRFSLVVAVYMYVFADFYCHGCTETGGNAAASWNMKTSGNGARFNSVTVS
jgi:hypothetical protein